MIGQNRAAFGGSRGYGIPVALAGQCAPYILGQSAVAVSGSEDTNENTLATITVTANSIGPNGHVRIRTTWTITNSANTKTLRVRFSGGSGTVYMAVALGAQATHNDLTEIHNRNSASSQVSGKPSSQVAIGQASTGALITSSVDTTVDTTIVITGQKALGTETLTLSRYCVETLYGA